MTVQLLLRSWITGLDVDIQWSELFLLRVRSQNSALWELYWKMVPFLVKRHQNSSLLAKCPPTKRAPLGAPNYGEANSTTRGTISLPFFSECMNVHWHSWNFMVKGMNFHDSPRRIINVHGLPWKSMLLRYSKLGSNLLGLTLSVLNIAGWHKV